jgi:predicted nucleotidyltransferase
VEVLEGLRRLSLGWRGDGLTSVIAQLRSVLETDPRIAYALLFGSKGRGTAHDLSDTDLAIRLAPGTKLSTSELGDLLSRLEAAAGGPVDLVLIDDAPLGLAYRVFRDGRIVFERDHRAFVDRKARAILEYLDFRPIEQLFTRAVLEVARRG